MSAIGRFYRFAPAERPSEFGRLLSASGRRVRSLEASRSNHNGAIFDSAATYAASTRARIVSARSML
ncbi:hypothetical protein PLANPX_3490 [Lacipirellula parvula]|uniref:Uncharacterized protein n=1 Tax=Lacipirellula parvula TaxID=2650471 RepID=A0A5K7XBJ2_9BACT|nr:hypothetical protein PLANPX_3490 [Lacipirellula parvula]